MQVTILASQGRGCRTNADCLITQACQGGACINPCVGQRCADHERCVVRSHAPVCACKHKLAINAVGELSCPGEDSSSQLFVYFFQLFVYDHRLCLGGLHGGRAVPADPRVRGRRLPEPVPRLALPQGQGLQGPGAQGR